MSYIRKISAGSDYKDAMHYIVGQRVMRGEYIINEIVEYENAYGIIVKNDEGVCMEWKRFKNVPVYLEYNMDLL